MNSLYIECLVQLAVIYLFVLAVIIIPLSGHGLSLQYVVPFVMSYTFKDPIKAFLFNWKRCRDKQEEKRAFSMGLGGYLYWTFTR